MLAHSIQKEKSMTIVAILALAVVALAGGGELRPKVGDGVKG